MGKVEPRDAATAPAPTQTTTTRAAVVLSNRANNVPRVADEEPTHPVLTGETLGVVEVQRNGGVRDPKDPVHTIRAGGHHHAIIVRNNKARGNPGQMASPVHEPIRTLTQACHQSLVMSAGGREVEARDGEVGPLPTVIGNDRLALVVPYDSTGRARAADEEPTPTLTTRDRAALVLSDDDIDDCRFRMFALHEIAEAMVMAEHVDGSEYLVLGNKRERMAQYGNAVTPPAMELLVGRLLEVV